MLELGREANKKKDGKPRNPIKGQVEELVRGRVDPVRVFENHQNRTALRQRLELVELSREQHFAFALRAEVEVGDGIRQRQQLGQQRYLVLVARATRE